MRAVIPAIAPVIPSVKAVVGHRPGQAAVHPIQARPSAAHLARTDHDVGDAHRSAEINRVLRHGITVRKNRLVEITHRHKDIGLRADPVVLVHARAVLEVLRVDRLRRQRTPAHQVLAVAPRNPGGGPGVPRNPDPTSARQQGPAAVVISSPAKRLTGNPGPALVGVDPAPLRIGPPARRGRRRGLPHVAVFRGLHPLPIGSESLVKHLVVAAQLPGPDRTWRARRARLQGLRERGPGRRRSGGRRGNSGPLGRQGLFFAGQFLALPLQFRFFAGPLIFLDLPPQQGLLGF